MVKRMGTPDDPTPTPTATTPLLAQSSTPETPATFYQNAWKILKTAAPMGASYTFSVEISVIGMLALKISKTPEDEAAVALFQTMTNFLDVLMISPLFVMGFVVGERFGELNKAQEEGHTTDEIEIIRNRIAEVYRSGLLAASFLTPLAMLPMALSGPLLRSLGQDPVVADKTADFFKLFMWASPGLQVRFLAEQAMFGMQKTLPAMIMALSSFAIGAEIAMWLGINGGLGVEPIGLPGIATGFIIENYLTALLFHLYIKFQKDFSKIPFLSIKKFSLKETIKLTKTILRNGSTITFAMFTEMSMTMVLGLLAGTQGIKEQADFAKAAQLVFVLLVPIAAFGATTPLLMRERIGAMDYQGAMYLARHAIGTTILSIAPICLPFLISPSLLNCTPTLGRFISGGLILDGIRYNFLQAIRASDKWTFSTLINSVGLMLGLAMAAILTFSEHAGTEALGAGYFLGILMSVLLLGKMWLFSTSASEIKHSVHQKSDMDPASRSCWYDARTFFTTCPPRASNELDDTYGYSQPNVP